MPAKEAKKKPTSQRRSTATRKSWNCARAMQELEDAGTAQNVKRCGRSGVRGPFFGVSATDYKRLARAIGSNDELARELWATGNHDARMLATMIADPAAWKTTELDRAAREADNHVLSDAVAQLVARSPHLESRVRQWTRTPLVPRNEYLVRCGFHAAATAVRERQAHPVDPDQDLPPELLAEIVERIATDIQRAPDRVREGMSNTLISIGAFVPDLTDEALAAAEAISDLGVDPCDRSATSDAVQAIQDARATEARKTGRRSRLGQGTGRKR